MAVSQRRLAAIMFTDMVGYSALAQANESLALDVLDRHNRLLRPLFAKFHGREIKSAGDGFLIEFGSALDAAQCAVEIQHVLHEYNLSAAAEWRVRIRIGIHVGDVVETHGDVLGDAVNLAARIEPVADPEGICLTQQVVDQVQNKIGVSFVKLPETVLKNIRTPMNLYKVVQPWDAPGRVLPKSESGAARQIAVLPLANISPDQSDEYFADGLTEELISTLSQVRGLSVIARTSIIPYKKAPKSIAQVGAELGVDAVIEGSVRKSGNRIRITLQLIDVATQRHLWASSYNREIDDVFAVQSDIAERTAEALRLELARDETPGSRRAPTTNPTAYDLYLRGLVAANDPEAPGFEPAVRYFEEATRLDPNFAEAFAAWAQLYVVAAGDSRSVRTVMPRARELAARALEIDPSSSDAHSATANIALQFDHDWGVAEAEFLKAIALNPSNVSAHRFYALLLISLERFDRAKELIRRAIQLDPGGSYLGLLGYAERESGNIAAAIEYGREAVAIHPTSVGAHNGLGLLYLAAGRREEAIREAETPETGADDTGRFDRALLKAMVGQPEAARQIISDVATGRSKAYISSGDLAILHGALGEGTRALDLLEQDLREGDRIFWLYYRGQFFDSIREEPRFLALLREYGLPTDPVGRPAPPSN
ncbi:MAG: adenylate/guanylate cyclase domain-containing protein [Thermoplasmata archaeon]